MTLKLILLLKSTQSINH